MIQRIGDCWTPTSGTFMSSPDIFEQAKLYLPKYLTSTQQRELFEQLREFPRIREFYLDKPPEQTLLQGDGWRGFVVLDFFTSERKVISGVILSNSCDISPENLQMLPGRVLFSPLIRLSKYRRLLRDAGRSDEQIEGKLASIRKQEVTSIFWLPELPGTFEESMILLDDIHTHPLDDFVQRDRSRIFTLSQVGFYVLLLKLSIHFSRFQEGVQRYN